MNRENISPIVQDVFASLLALGDEGLFYKPDPARPALPPHLQYPAGPGGRCYSRMQHVTSTRITGVDGGFITNPPLDVPQDVITAYRQAFMDGLRLFMPVQAANAYLSQRLEQPCFARYNQPRKVGDRVRDLTELLPRIVPQPASGRPVIRKSLEHDIRYDFDQAGMFDIRHDRRNMARHDLVRLYDYSSRRPELLAALFLWQNCMTDYNSELRNICCKHFANVSYDDVRKKGLYFDFNQTIERIFPIYFAIDFTANSTEAPTFPLFLGGAIAAMTGNDDAIPAQTFKDAIMAARQAGVFRRAFDTTFGPRKVTCPFSHIGMQMMTSHLDGMDKADDMAIARCYKKILEERHTPRVEAVCDAIQSGAHDLLAGGGSFTETAPATGGCPMHRNPA